MPLPYNKHTLRKIYAYQIRTIIEPNYNNIETIYPPSHIYTLSFHLLSIYCIQFVLNLIIIIYLFRFYLSHQDAKTCLFLIFFAKRFAFIINFDILFLVNRNKQNNHLGSNSLLQ